VDPAGGLSGIADAGSTRRRPSGGIVIAWTWIELPTSGFRLFGQRQARRRRPLQMTVADRRES